MAQSIDTTKLALCDRHLPHHLDRHPFTMFTVLLMEDKIRYNPEFLNRVLDLKSFEQAYKELYPLCCYLGDDKMNEIYDKASKILGFNGPSPTIG